MEAPGLYRNYVMLLTTAGLLEKRPEVALRILRAVIQAEEFIRQRPAATLALAQAIQIGSAADTEKLLHFYQYHVSLDHALLMGLEDTARWTLEQSGDHRGEAPNFLKLIAADPLRAVGPDRVRLEK